MCTHGGSGEARAAVAATKSSRARRGTARHLFEKLAVAELHSAAQAFASEPLCLVRIRRDERNRDDDECAAACVDEGPGIVVRSEASSRLSGGAIEQVAPEAGVMPGSLLDNRKADLTA